MVQKSQISLKNLWMFYWLYWNNIGHFVFKISQLTSKYIQELISKYLYEVTYKQVPTVYAVTYKQVYTITN